MTDREKRFFATIFKLSDKARDIANSAVKRLAEETGSGIGAASLEASRKKEVMDGSYEDTGTIS
jgi:hypothetical protein